MKPVQSSYVAYYRVSTDRQGRSKLGLEAQKQAVESFIPEGSNILREFTEVESGKKNNRPQLQEALAYCRKHKATLLIAKLDRLGRNLAFIASLMDAGVEFICCDNPHANKLMLHMLAAFAEHEREQISQRTKQALAAAKARGVRLGEYSKPPEKRNKTRAQKFAGSVWDEIERIRREGAASLAEIATALNEKNIPSARGGIWYASSVSNVIARMESV